MQRTTNQSWNRPFGTCSRLPNSAAFPPLQQRLWEENTQTLTTHSKGHGRFETRTITTTTWLNDYLDWPQIQQAFRLVRERRVGAKKTIEIVFGITSLSRDEADAGKVLGFSRSHWGIENGLHYTRDETQREDRCRVRKGNAPRVLASMRNVAVHLLRAMGGPSAAAATRELAADPQKALDLLRDPGSTSA